MADEKKPHFDFWKAVTPDTGKPSVPEKGDGKKDEVLLESKKALHKERRETIVKDSIWKRVIEKNKLYGTTQEYFNRPENADKKAILNYRLGIDIDHNPVNSDAFMSALAHFQVEHKAEIGFDRDGWFAIIPEGMYEDGPSGPTPTWIAMFGTAEHPFVIPAGEKTKKEKKEKSEKSKKEQYQGFDIPSGLTPPEMIEWIGYIDALTMIDGLKNVTYDRNKREFVYVPTGETLSPAGRNREFMIDWVGDRNARQLIVEGKQALLDGVTYDSDKNVYQWQGQTLPRDYQSLETLRKWQDEIVPRYIVATLGGEKLREFYKAWEAAPNKYSFAGLINKFWPGIPYPTKADIQDASAAQHDPLGGKPPTDEQFRQIFEKIQANGGYPPAELLPTPPALMEVDGRRLDADVIYLNQFIETTPEILKLRDVGGNEYMGKIRDLALPIVEARQIMENVRPLDAKSFRGDMLPLENIRNRLERLHTQSHTAQDSLRWNWNTSLLAQAEKWHAGIQRDIDIVTNVIKQVEDAAMSDRAPGEKYPTVQRAREALRDIRKNPAGGEVVFDIPSAVRIRIVKLFDTTSGAVNVYNRPLIDRYGKYLRFDSDELPTEKVHLTSERYIALATFLSKGPHSLGEYMDYAKKYYVGGAKTPEAQILEDIFVAYLK